MQIAGREEISSRPHLRLRFSLENLANVIASPRRQNQTKFSMKLKFTGSLSIAAAISVSVIGSAQQPRPPAPPPPPTGQPPPIHPQSGKRPAIRPEERRTQPNQLGIQPRQPRLGDPLPGLPANLLAAFTDGRDDFLDRETPASGLGPIFNRYSCVACHGGPAVGGSSPVNVTRFGSVTNGRFDPLTALGGSLLQERSLSPTIREVVPPQATVRARRNSTALFGLGLIEAIPDATILANVKVLTADGVRGKAHLVTDVATGTTRVGRFGWKAQQASLLAFAGDAYVNEMGITNRLFPTENAPNGDEAKLAQLDQIADPEDQTDPVTGKQDIDKIADFMRFLGAPPAVPLSSSAALGRNVFNQVGCNQCHTPTLMTGANPVAALNFKPVNLYSDLLLHDMGPLGDGIVQGEAGPREMKTPPLWGVRASAPYLHDGRAPSLDAAIRAHDGEAKAARDKFNALPSAQRQQLLDFLNSI